MHYFMASVDSVADNTGFAQKNAATFPILADPTKTTAKAYGVLGSHGYANRWTFYIDAEGLIVAIDKAVQPRTAGQQLVANLEALKVPRADSR
ncbi:MAG: redoxin domain-containing protein [Gammaproteobacteria bacterium]|nr:redoxin domain-containing protein [Gammaproteobacteria bacterium]